MQINDLKRKKTWCLWRYEVVEKDGRQRITKPPCKKVPASYEWDDSNECWKQPSEGYHYARSNDASGWMTYSFAADQLSMTSAGHPVFNGCGLMFSKIDGMALCGIDIDAHHRDRNQYETDILKIFSAKTYTETSPSGKGYHILGLVNPQKLPSISAYKAQYYLTREGETELECHISGHTNRYFTFTGNMVDGSTEELADITAEVLTFLNRYMKRENRETTINTEGAAPSAVAYASALPALTDDEIRERLSIARHAKNGFKFTALFDEGRTDMHGDDRSAADQALMTMLAQYLNCDADAMWKVFQESELYKSRPDQEKWERANYRETTIANAIKFAQESGFIYAPRPKLKPIDFSDSGNAELFAQLYSDRVRWSLLEGWLVWNGKVWVRSENKAQSVVKDFAFDMLCEAQKEQRESVPGADLFVKHAIRTRSSAAITNILKLARSSKRRGATGILETLEVEANDLDADPWIINTPAGIYDLHTGEKRPHDPTKLCTKITRYAPSDQGAEEWQRFLDSITTGEDGTPDKSLQQYLRQVVGMAIIGKVCKEGLIICEGSGANGKSTFWNVLIKVLGDYASTINSDVLLASGRGDDDKFRSDKAKLRGLRLVVCGETQQSARLNEAQVKKLTSTDDIDARRMRQDAESFTPSHQLVMFTNHLPRVSGTDAGIWRRLTIVPFHAQMPSADSGKRIEDYASVLAENCGPAIMQWMITGATDYEFVGSLVLPTCVQAATAQYRNNENWIQTFIRECCTVAPLKEVADSRGRMQVSSDLVTSHATLYKAYKQNAIETGEPFIRKRPEFIDALKHCVYEDIKTDDKGHREVMKYRFRLLNTDNKPRWAGIAVDPAKIDTVML